MDPERVGFSSVNNKRSDRGAIDQVCCHGNRFGAKVFKFRNTIQ